MTENVTITRENGVATITIDRPDSLNALNVNTLEALDHVLDETDDARTLVLTGAGEDAFVAGADIEYMKTLSVEEAMAYAELGHRICDRLATHSAPVIAAVNGYAFGGGCELALACDLRVASENAVLGQTEIDLGIVPGWGGTQRLSRLVGDAAARRMVFLGERLDAESAAEIGLVGEVVPQAELDSVVEEMAAQLAAKPRFALAAAKEALNQVHEGPQSSGLEYEKRLWSGLFGTDDQREGMAAFVEKRDPEFE
ncbi:enoyl-CoA hydratase/isomerase family protein [Halalkalicoccus jeotgali]|uniref:Enoyl-CoA hydratase n=1 Tax=Halalkalicoccus jeotgali (strain DSM 18796 / CECT 7217 / JCM 14584 / KCTC 4019 / B3) TaxID=795797 RepID=D8J8B4_HALJB|nr:enoyl-CoA hydratase-related protein [Halalkalicoccus jeotgali]ADJ16160.1 enoyl-CoA hydratase [Halalkalicoccus jeotgali B3]ELY37589.1 enoyl-CoA hydratase [Halalkalicoccus jeotgali B3]